MVVGWRTVELGDVAAVRSGYAFKSADWTPAGIPVVKMANVKGGRLEMEGCSFVSELTASDAIEFHLAAGDILVSMTGHFIGDVGLVRDTDVPCVLNQRVGRFKTRDQNQLDAGFLYAFLTTPETRRAIKGLGYGSAQPNVSPALIQKVAIRLPPIAEQRGIAATVGALDDKVHSNFRAISLLEDLGSALLSDALTLDVYGFPEYDNERIFGDLLALLETGMRPKGGASADGVGVVSLGAESIQSAGIITTEKFKTVPREYADNMRRGRLVDEDVLVYKDGGRPGNFIPHISAFGYGFPVEEAVINEHVYRVRAIDGVSQGLVYWVLRSPWMDKEMRRRGTGVAIPGLNSTNFRNLPMPVIPTETIGQLNHKLSPMFAALLRYGAENRRLVALRNTLVPELLSGRIRVPEAVDAVAGASA